MTDPHIDINRVSHIVETLTELEDWASSRETSIDIVTAMFKIVKTELAKLDNLGFDSYQDCLLAIFDEPDFLYVWDFSGVPVETCQLINNYRNLFMAL